MVGLNYFLVLRVFGVTVTLRNFSVLFPYTFLEGAYGIKSALHQFLDLNSVTLDIRRLTLERILAKYIGQNRRTVLNEALSPRIPYLQKTTTSCFGNIVHADLNRNRCDHK